MSRTRRSRTQWQDLIDEFEQSGLSQTEFCQSQQLNPKYFSLKRSKLKASTESPRSGFVRVNPAPQAAAPIGIIVQFGSVRIGLPEHTAPSTLSELVKALA